MQITFTGPDGNPVTVTDPRRAAKTVSVALPEERRPAAFIIIQMKA
jgi:hypothetical protein